MIDYLSNQSNHCKTYETLVNMGFSGVCFWVRFSHPLLLTSRKANKINAFRLFCFTRKCQGTKLRKGKCIVEYERIACASSTSIVAWGMWRGRSRIYNSCFPICTYRIKKLKCSTHWMKKSQWTTISHSSSALWLCARLFDNYFFLLFFHILYITLETGSKTHIATNQPGKCGIISILLILYKIEYSRYNADGSNDKWYNNS